MATFVFGMNQTLDGYVDHTAFAPGPTLFRHFIESTRAQTGFLYGRRMYEVMRYWDDDDAGWDAGERAFAAAWRLKPKWVVTRSLEVVGPRATVIGSDIEGAVRRLKAEQDGEIEVAGLDLASTLAMLGLIDEYRVYLHPVTLGRGTPFFAEPPQPLRLAGHDLVGEDVIRFDLRARLITRRSGTDAAAGQRGAITKTGHPISVRQAAGSAVSRGPTR